MDKRGISVIISSILLILIVISLFSVVAYFMRKSPEKIMQEGSESFEKMINCDEVNLEIGDICYKEATVDSKDYANEMIVIMIKNNNRMEFDKFRIKYSTGNTLEIGPAVQPLAAYETKYISPPVPLNYDKNNGWLKLYPIVNGNTCNSKEYKINMKGVERCS